MGSDRYDVIVVGVGAMGSATCYQLASRGGVRVLGLEQFAIPHERGSSHGISRLYRLAYYEHPDYVPLLRQAVALWRRLEAETGATLMHETGLLYLGRPDGEVIAGSLRAAREHELPVEMIDRSQLTRQFPQFVAPNDFVAMHERSAGFLLSERCIAAHVDVALQRGADIRGNERVVEWNADARGVRVTSDRATYHADRLVFCGGAWSDKLVRDLGVPLRVSRQVMGWVQPPEPEALRLGVFPCWAVDPGDGSLFYGFPMTPDGAGLKLARHRAGPTADPDTLNRQPTRDDEFDFRPALANYIPQANGPIVSMRVCMYTNSPDGHFILDRHPRFGNVFICCGFSGHGFKFASVVGQAMAGLAVDGRTSLPIDFLRLGRFTQ
jgi:sarcosine oxidase